MIRRRLRPLLALAFLLSCGSEASLELRQARLLPSPAGNGMGAIYLTIVSHGDDDRLLGAQSPVVHRIELHEMKMDGEIMRMNPVEAIEIPSGATVVLGPQGFHLMAFGIAEELEPGASVPLTLQFENAGSLSVDASVGDR